MIKQIVDFSRETERGTAIIDVFMMVEDPQKHIEAIKSLAKDGAIILFADGDTIRARYKDTTQDKLLKLIEEGWTFASQEEPDALNCRDQIAEDACGDCLEPRDMRGREGGQ